MAEGVCVVGGMHGTEACVEGGVHGRGGMHIKGGCVWWGACVAGGVHGEEACVAGETATAVEGTHPTGMHSCCAMETAVGHKYNS